MGAAAPAVGSVVVGALVGTAATKVASSLGLSDGMASLVGMGAGMMAGGMVTGGAGTQAGLSPAVSPAPSTVPATAPGMPMDMSVPDVSLAGASDAGAGMTMGGGSPDLTMAQPPSTPLTQGMDTGGMLSMAAPPVAAAPPTASQQMVSQGLQQAPDPGLKAQPSWFERMFTPERVGDYLAAGIQGYSQAEQRKWELERDYEREDELRDRWNRADPGRGGLLSLTPTYRSQGGSY